MSRALQISEKGYELSQPKQMQAMAAVLKQHVVENKLYTPIANKNYVQVEGWQFAGGLMGTFPRIASVENLSDGSEIKWRADAEIVDLKTGNVISRGIAVCSSKEGKKKGFDEYAILSMAQTRAIGKAYRNVIGWVMKLAGYESTPSEDMMKAGETVVPGEKPEPTIQYDDDVELVCHGIGKTGCGEDITRQEYDYSKKIYGKPLCRKHQKEAKPVKKGV